MNTVYLSTAYFAPVSYYAALLAYDKVVIEQWCNYTKQTYRNRCHIAGANGILPLSVPVVKPDTLKCPTRDIRISDHGEWRHLHWNAIASAYGSSPFFEYYQDDIRPFFEKHYEYLFDFNEEIRHKMCELLEIEPPVVYSPQYAHPLPGETDWREAIHPKKKTTETAPSIRLRPYYQVFADKYGFLPDLSIIDLLMNMGPESILILKDS